MKPILKYFALLFFSFISLTVSYGQCSVCTITNPVSLPDPIPAGTTICITVNKTYGGSINLTGGSIHVCGGAKLRINGAAELSATSSITTTGCSQVEVNGNIHNNNPVGLMVLDACSCPTAITATGPIFGFGVVCGPLPVELISFNTTVENNTVNIDWSTATEINNDHFIVERSNDLLKWTEVTRVAGAGNSNAILNYGVNDVVSPGLYYYRLVQVDINGDQEIFDPKAVTVSGSENIMDLNIYPNPASEMVVIKLGGTSDAVIEIFNLSGQVIYTSKLSSSDSREIRIDLSGFNNGVYLVKAFGENISQSSKLIINKN
jgi:hypothetical protein